LCENGAEVEKSTPCIAVSLHIALNLDKITADDVIRTQVSDLATIKPVFEVADMGLEAKVMVKCVKGVVGLCKM
jgi:hypothetical protein